MLRKRYIHVVKQFTEFNDLIIPLLKLQAIKATYAKVLGSAVNPVLREGMSEVQFYIHSSTIVFVIFLAQFYHWQNMYVLHKLAVPDSKALV